MAKTTLMQAKGQSYYCDGRLSVGVYLQDESALLIDSGIDKSNAKSINKALEEAGYKATTIINTHHHADHCGGNNYFQQTNQNLKIYATSFEKVFIEKPFLEPLSFCCGASPYTGLRNKFLEANESVVTHEISEYHDQEIEINKTLFKIITLPGHTYGSIGVITPDNVLYCGDAIFTEDTFNKHGVLFYTDIKEALKSFDKLSQLTIEATIFYHNGVKSNIHDLVINHKKRILETADIIDSLIQSSNTGLCVDKLTQLVMKKFFIPESVVSYTLTRTCVNAYITYLESAKRLQVKVTDGLLIIEKD